MAIIGAELALFGPDAPAFHLVNLAFHAANGMLLFSIARTLSGRLAAAGLASIFFVTHQIPFLAVYWVSGIQELSLAFFLLLSLNAYLAVRISDRRMHYLLSLAAYALALLSKEVAVVWPALLLLVELAPLRSAPRASIRVIATRLVPYLILVILFLAIRSQKTPYLMPASGPYTWYANPGLAIDNLMFYFSDVFGYRAWLTTAPSLALVATCALVLVFALLAAQVRGCRWPTLIGLAWFTLTLLPVLFLQRSYSYYAYLSLAGIAVAIAQPLSMVGARLAELGARFASRTGHSLSFGGSVLLLSALFLAMILFSRERIREAENMDPAGIVSKSIIAQQALLGVRLQYPQIPAGATLHIVSLTERDSAAIGYGDLFRFHYPDI